MPGLVVFQRRWGIGSDDLIIPAIFHFIIHLIWGVILTVLVNLEEFDTRIQCVILFKGLILGYLVILGISMITELCICMVAMKGSILDTARRSSMQYLVCCRIAILVVESGWLSAGIAWFAKFYLDCPITETAKETVLGMIICNFCVLLSILLTIWCTFDAAGKAWVKMMRAETGSDISESWREKIFEESWEKRLQFRFCCNITPINNNEDDRYTFSDAARLFSQFFRDLDVVPSDITAGLILLRNFQKNRQDSTHQFLSRVPVTPNTKFLKPDSDILENLKHYFYYAVRAYVASASPNCAPCRNRNEPLDSREKSGATVIVYATYHVDVNETPFFVALDFEKRKIVISIRGTSSIKDVLTDLNAECEILPLNETRDDFFGHRGMVQAARYIFEQILEKDLIEQARNHDFTRGTSDFDLVIVGHSLGAGIASVLGILLGQSYENLKCFCFSPPGGLLSMPAVEFTKTFAISVTVGNDVVIRSGLNQMETLRRDLINVIEKSEESKWKIITCNSGCCGCSRASFVHSSRISVEIQNSNFEMRRLSHPALYPPGRIIHLVRHHRTKRKNESNKETHYALWAENTDFDQVLISSSMIQDHKVDTVLKALNNVEKYDFCRK